VFCVPEHTDSVFWLEVVGGD